MVLRIAIVTCKNTSYCNNLYLLFYTFLFGFSLSSLFFFFHFLSLCPTTHSLCSALPNSSLNLSQTLFLSLALALTLSSGLSMAVGLRMWDCLWLCVCSCGLSMAIGLRLWVYVALQRCRGGATYRGGCAIAHPEVLKTKGKK